MLFCQVGDQVNQVKDQVGQGQGQELDNTTNLFPPLPLYTQIFTHLLLSNVGCDVGE